MIRIYCSLRFALVLLLIVPWGCQSGGKRGGTDRSRASRLRSSEARRIPGNEAHGFTSVDGPVDVLEINGEIVTVEDVLKPVRKDLLERASRMAPDQYATYLDRAVRAAVRQLARNALLYHEASKNLTEEEEDYLGRLADDRIRKRVTAEYGGRQTRFEKALAAEGGSLEEERDRSVRELTVMRWLQMTITPRITDPTRDALWRVYESQLELLSIPARRDMQLIEISVIAQLPEEVAAPDEEQMQAARDAARKKATEVLEKLSAGDTFEETARWYSTGLHARNGGSWGWVAKGSVREHLAPVVDALFDLAETGVPSEIIETEHALYIVQCAGVQKGERPEFETIQPELVDAYRETRFSELVEETIAELHSHAVIRPRDTTRFLRAVTAAAPKASAAVGAP